MEYLIFTANIQTFLFGQWMPPCQQHTYHTIPLATAYICSNHMLLYQPPLPFLPPACACARCLAACRLPCLPQPALCACMPCVPAMPTTATSTDTLPPAHTPFFLLSQAKNTYARTYRVKLYLRVDGVKPNALWAVYSDYGDYRCYTKKTAFHLLALNSVFQARQLHYNIYVSYRSIYR